MAEGRSRAASGSRAVAAARRSRASERPEESRNEQTLWKRPDIQEILELLPHRYPFLMVDRIIEMDGDHSAIGIKNVTFNEPHFQGHFPGQPVFPGVLIIEGMAQTAGAICVAARPTAKRRASISSPSTKPNSASRSCPGTCSSIT